jgi:hypothetical protein
LLVGLGIAGWWLWHTWVPAQLQLQVSLLKQQLKTDYQLRAEVGQIQLSPYGLTHAMLTLKKVELYHAIGEARVPQVRLYVPIGPLLEKRALRLSEVVLEQPAAKLLPGWTDYAWPKQKPSNDQPLRRAVLRVVNGYRLDLPDHASANGPGLVWKDLDTTNSPMHVSGTYRMPGVASAFQGDVRFHHWAVEGASLLTQPSMVLSALSKAQQTLLRQWGLAGQALPNIALAWTPKNWTIAFKQPSQLRLTLPGGGRQQLVIDQLQATGQSQGKLIQWNAAQLQGQWLDPAIRVNGAPKPQPWRVLSQGQINLANQHIDAQTMLPKGSTLQGQWRQPGKPVLPWRVSADLTSHWTGTLASPYGRHQVHVHKLVNPYGQQTASLRLITQGNHWTEGWIQQAAGQFRQAAFQAKGHITPMGFNGLATLSHCPLTAKQLAGLGPLPVTPNGGQLNAVVQQVRFSRQAPLLVGQVRLTDVRIPGYPTLKQGVAQLHGHVVTVQHAVVPVAGGVLQANGQINLANQHLAMDAYGGPFQLAQLKQQFPQYLADLPANVTGQADMKARITGTMKNPVVNADIQLRQLNGRVQQVALNNGQVDIQYRHNQWVARVINGVVGYQGMQPVAIKGWLHGAGAQLNRLHLDTQGVALADLSQSLGIPLQSGSADVTIAQVGNRMQVHANVQQAKAVIQGHTVGWNGQLTARLPKTKHPLAALNVMWIDIPQSTLSLDGLPIQVSATGYPNRQLVASTALGTTDLWKHPALRNWVAAQDAPPYQDLFAQWFISPSLIRLDKLEARHPIVRSQVVQAIPSAAQHAAQEHDALEAKNQEAADVSQTTTVLEKPQTTVGTVIPNATDTSRAAPASLERTPLPPVYPLHQHIGLHIYPKQRERWVQGELNISDGVNLSLLEPYLNPAFFKGLAGQLNGHMRYDYGPVGFGIGQFTGQGLTVPEIGVKPMDGQLTLTGAEGHVNLAHLTVPGVTDATIAANTLHWHDMPLRFEQATITGEQFHIGRFQNYINEVLIGRVSKQLVTPIKGEWQPGNLVLPFELSQADTRFKEVIYQNIILSDVSGYLDVLASSYTAFKQAKLTAAGGDVTGEITLDPIANNFLTLNLHANHVQANPLSRALLNVSNQLFGEVTGDIRFTTSGQTETENLQNTNGTGSIRVVNGRVPALTRVEALLTGANIIRTGVLGLSLNNIMRILWPFEVNDFKDMTTDMQFTNGRVYMLKGMRDDQTPIRPLVVKNPNLTIEAEGSIGLINADADMVIRGKMRQNVKGTFGKLGQVSVLYLLGHIPGINLGKGRNLLAYIPGVGFIPGVGGPPQKGKTNYFTVRVKGPFGAPSSIQGLQWGQPSQPAAPSSGR